jgi:hypothetical protein
MMNEGCLLWLRQKLLQRWWATSWQVQLLISLTCSSKMAHEAVLCGEDGRHGKMPDAQCKAGPGIAFAVWRWRACSQAIRVPCSEMGLQASAQPVPDEPAGGFWDPCQCP